MSLLDDEDIVLANEDILIHDWIKNNCKISGSYKINNGIVDVDGSVFVTNKNITSIGVQFGKVTEIFGCSYCPSLTSLKGSPKEVGKGFYCSYCPSLTFKRG